MLPVKKNPKNPPREREREREREGERGREGERNKFSHEHIKWWKKISKRRAVIVGRGWWMVKEVAEASCKILNGSLCFSYPP